MVPLELRNRNGMDSNEGKKREIKILVRFGLIIIFIFIFKHNFMNQ